MAKLLILLLLAVIGGGVWFSCKSCNAPKPPNLDPEEWWGPEKLKGKQDNSIKDFKIKFSDEMISDLKSRLKSHRPFTPPLEGVGFEYGFNTLQLNPWIKFWSEEYKFKEREQFLNQFPQYTTNIQGLDIHFIRVKPQVKAGVEVVPLLMIHGWPGSVREFYEAIPILTKQAPGYNFAFEVIVPSLPGYGFSDSAVRPGLGAVQTAVIMSNLMKRLGITRYYVQGGDWGSVVTASMATLYQDEVLGMHNNMLTIAGHPCAQLMTLIGSVFPSLVVSPELQNRLYPLADKFAFAMEEFGYFHLQATKPDTIGIALSQSPVGLLAYILEKFSTWTALEARSTRDGRLPGPWKKEQLVDNLMIYWASNSATTSMRFYAETMSQKHRDLEMDKITTTVPTWALQAKEELFYQPPSLLKYKYVNLLNATVLDQGGHFVAFELPKVFSEDVFKAVKAFKEWHENNKVKKTEL